MRSCADSRESPQCRPQVVLYLPKGEAKNSAWTFCTGTGFAASAPRVPLLEPPNEIVEPHRPTVEISLQAVDAKIRQLTRHLDRLDALGHGNHAHAPGQVDDRRDNHVRIM